MKLGGKKKLPDGDHLWAKWLIIGSFRLRHTSIRMIGANRDMAILVG